MADRITARMGQSSWLARLLLVLTLPWLPACQRKAPPGNYDLAPAFVTVRPAVVHVGDKVVLDHGVKNLGRDTVPGKTFNVDLYLDGKRVSFDHGTFDLGPGQKNDYGMAAGYFHWQPTKPGKYRYRLVVDELNNLPETDEKNNVMEADIEVLP
ncbi:CARDB domain-containing protein [Prosthecobacter sp.]|uniref:CARDB domain-containing protein n=1 Tax=Prosthecobacter sp. TaxID=1965333 RepID=UPI0037846D62